MAFERFDRLARTLRQPRSRRSLTRLLGGLGLGEVLVVRGTTETLAGKRKPGEPCTKGKQCKTHKCVGGTGRKRCGCSQKFPNCISGYCVDGVCAPCPRCYDLDNNSQCTRTQDPMNDRCPCGFTEEADGYCYKDGCQDCYVNVGGVCEREPDGTAPNGLCDCGYKDVGGICEQRYPLPSR